MHVVSNIRDLPRFLGYFPFAMKDVPTGDERLHRNYKKCDRAYHYDLVLAQVVQQGATYTEDKDGNRRELLLDEWLIAPMIGRESTRSYSSVLPVEGFGIGDIIDYITPGGGLGLCPDIPPGKGIPTKVQVMKVLQFEDGNAVTSFDFGLNTLKDCDKICPIIAVVGSRSGAGKSTACREIIKGLSDKGKKVGVAILAGTAGRKEILALSTNAHRWLDMADAGMPTTYPPSAENDDRAKVTAQHAVVAAERILRDLSRDSDVLVVELGGDLLSASVPQLLAAQTLRRSIVALVMAAESVTAVIGMETKLHRIPPHYMDIPKYVVGSCTNLKANKNRVMRETCCAGCFDVWSQRSEVVPQKQADASDADCKELVERLVLHCSNYETNHAHQ